MTEEKEHQGETIDVDEDEVEDDDDDMKNGLVNRCDEPNTTRRVRTEGRNKSVHN
jgi:hypothetical protein